MEPPNTGNNRKSHQRIKVLPTKTLILRRLIMEIRASTAKKKKKRKKDCEWRFLYLATLIPKGEGETKAFFRLTDFQMESSPPYSLS